MTRRLSSAALISLAALTVCTPAFADPATCKAMDQLIADEEARRSSAMQELRGYLTGIATFIGSGAGAEDERGVDTLNFDALTAVMIVGDAATADRLKTTLAHMRGRLEAHNQTLASLKNQRSKMDCKAQEASKPAEPAKPQEASKPKPVQQASKPVTKKPKGNRQVVEEDDGGGGIAAAAPIAIGIMGMGMGGGGYGGGHRSGGGYSLSGSSGSSGSSGKSYRRY